MFWSISYFAKFISICMCPLLKWGIIVHDCGDEKDDDGDEDVEMW